MDLTSTIFFIFLPLTASFYFIAPQKIRPVVLLLLSTAFISTFDIFLVLFLTFYILFNYFLGYFLKKKPSKTLLFAAITVNVSLLLYHKYSTSNFITLIGISFFTFKNISFLIDCYRHQIKHLNPLVFANFITFFPEFLSGPIDRYQHFQSQSATQKTSFSSQNFLNSTYRIILGTFKKLVLANNIAVIINPVYQNFLPHPSLDLYLTSILYSLQLLFDFSGYTDIAIGSAKILGIVIPENFNFPYLITNIRQFWNRWHITLSCWFRDYLYIPLGGNRKGLLRQIANIIIVFLATGIWHGNGFGFIAWGLLHGFYQVAALIIEKQQKIKIKLPPILSILLTFNLVNFAWIFFRLKSVRASLLFIKTIIVLKPGFNLQMNPLYPPFLIGLILFLLIKTNKSWAKIAIFLLSLISVALFANTAQPDFLYFKF